MILDPVAVMNPHADVRPVPGCHVGPIEVRHDLDAARTHVNHLKRCADGARLVLANKLRNGQHRVVRLKGGRSTVGNVGDSLEGQLVLNNPSPITNDRRSEETSKHVALELSATVAVPSWK
jgi:hypothetical protein